MKSDKKHNDKEWVKWIGTNHFNKGAYRERAEFLQSWVKDIKPNKIKEIASGGYIMAKLTQDNFPHIDYRWTEFSDVAIKEAKAGGIKDVSYFDVREAEEEDFNGYDLVICFGTDHIEKDLELFRKIKTRKIACIRGRKTPNHFRGFKNKKQVLNRYKEFKINRIHALNVRLGRVRDVMYLLDFI